MSRVVVLAGEGEYSSHEAMRPVADRLVAELGVALDYRVPDVLPDTPDFPASSFGDLSALDDADLLIIYTRWRRLPEAEMAALERFRGRGGNVLGLRTSSHAFRFPPSSRWAGWNDGFGRDVLGTPWVSHHGWDSKTALTRPAVDPDPIVADLPERLEVRSWLYRTELRPDCRPILWGTARSVEGPDPEPEPPEPVAWTRTAGDQRVFFTTLGHPEDLAMPAVEQVLVNAARWALARTG